MVGRGDEPVRDQRLVQRHEPWQSRDRLSNPRDVVLPPPWRVIGSLIAITALLKFGCSTAFLFVVIQDVWMRHL
jgi:hypothetical protein